jgi:hypothetical protein
VTKVHKTSAFIHMVHNAPAVSTRRNIFSLNQKATSVCDNDFMNLSSRYFVMHLRLLKFCDSYEFQETKISIVLFHRRICSREFTRSGGAIKRYPTRLHVDNEQN